MTLRLKTRLFDGNIPISDLADKLGVSLSQVYRVRQGKRGINESFIIASLRAFPDRNFEDMFYLSDR